LELLNPPLAICLTVVRIGATENLLAGKVTDTPDEEPLHTPAEKAYGKEVLVL
jgi:hypothetical protein